MPIVLDKNLMLTSCCKFMPARQASICIGLLLMSNSVYRSSVDCSDCYSTCEHAPRIQQFKSYYHVTTGPNVALTRPASQYTTWNTSVASLAVDGDPFTRSCSFGQNQSWWSVDLGSSRLTVGVQVVNNWINASNPQSSLSGT